MSNSLLPRIQQKLCDSPSIGAAEPDSVGFIYPYRQCRTKPESYPAVTNDPNSCFRPRLISFSWFEFDFSLTKQAFRDVNDEVFERDDYGLEEEEFE